MSAYERWMALFSAHMRRSSAIESRVRNGLRNPVARAGKVALAREEVNARGHAVGRPCLCGSCVRYGL